MSITSSKLVVEGLVTYIRSIPIQGITAIIDYVDDAVSSVLTSYWEKTFRYTTNGITYTDFTPLDLPTLEALTFDPSDIVIFEIAFTAHQPDGANDLTVSNFYMDVVTGTYTPTQDQFGRSIFAPLFESYDSSVLSWQISVLEKLYEEGIVPSYIQRANLDDYLAFWNAITKFFAFYVAYARVYSTFETYVDLIAEFLIEKGVCLSVTSTIDDMTLLMNTYHTQIAHRGTARITDMLRFNPHLNVDGELMRLLFYNHDTDEFIFNPYKTQHFGWNLGNSSPLHRGMYLNDNANKYWNKGFPVNDLHLTPHVGSFDIVFDSDLGFNVIKMGSPGYLRGFYENPYTGGKDWIKVDPSLSYEVSLIIKSDHPIKVQFGIEAFNESMVPVLCLSTQGDGAHTNWFLDGGIVLDTHDQWTVVRGILYSSSTLPSASHITQTHQGRDLIMNPATAWIGLDFSESASVGVIAGDIAFVYGIRIMPIATDYSRGFVQVKNFISAWFVNRNKMLTTLGLQEYIKEYLIPYNSIIAIKSLDEIEMLNPSNPIAHIFVGADTLTSFASSWLVGKTIGVSLDGLVLSLDDYSFDNTTGRITPTVPFEVGQRLVVFILAATPLNLLAVGGEHHYSDPSLMGQSVIVSIDGYVQGADQYTFDNTIPEIDFGTPLSAGQKLVVFVVNNSVSSNPNSYLVTGTGDTVSYHNDNMINQQVGFALDGLVQCPIDQYNFDKLLGTVTPTDVFAAGQRIVTFIL